MPNVTNILLVGVGGQGTILAGKILAQVGLAQGLDVKMSEIHGMAQRGGSVVTQVRMGEQVFSPLIEPGEADFLVAFEKLEAYRWAQMLRPAGTVIINDQRIDPLPVLVGAAVYPPDIVPALKARFSPVLLAPAQTLAGRAGSEKAANVVLMGMLAAGMTIPLTIWQEALAAVIPPKLLAINRRAFAAGLETFGN
ncbi:MAG: indolepyruvate oxidoreductase subunit beta [Heliobacteriaceae bacterium]|nr:indolepyruvate oxidoreductase subunit beta [Heliobacteriaceae bacterium]MDD4587770.1 indolepyruvate oxidoreductase subunit beta [Heliobacteriaceae bacterium]